MPAVPASTAVVGSRCRQASRFSSGRSIAAAPPPMGGYQSRNRCNATLLHGASRGSSFHVSSCARSLLPALSEPRAVGFTRDRTGCKCPPADSLTPHLRSQGCVSQPGPACPRLGAQSMPDEEAAQDDHATEHFSSAAHAYNATHHRPAPSGIHAAAVHPARGNSAWIHTASQRTRNTSQRTRIAAE